jgi:hypothetical protein
MHAANMPSPTKLGAIVTQNSLLRQLFREAAENRSHNERIRELIDEPLRAHVRFALLKGDTVILIADSSAWASKLRYQVAAIQRRMESSPEMAAVRNIRVKVAAAETTTRIPARRAQALSATTAEGVRRQAESIEDPLLREAVMKLSGHRRRDDGR